MRLFVGALLGAALGFVAGVYTARRVDTHSARAGLERSRIETAARAELERSRIEAAIQAYRLEYGRDGQTAPHQEKDVRGLQAPQRTN